MVDRNSGRGSNASPNDGSSSGHCVCENCRAWDHPNGEPRLMHWHHREVRPGLSDRHVTFANKSSQDGQEILDDHCAGLLTRRLREPGEPSPGHARSQLDSHSHSFTITAYFIDPLVFWRADCESVAGF